ncbi:hypothetical protein [Spiroplasma endosymbiont of Lariophagus distinguendus]|uniref:hypothetical protein n=1 Tax=Spiroplasma endosymbiont of Lariophagus distinguendus TaxID=2935082 RepID=UPI002079DEFA|nr:hypothetical protein [Spiroplasma endosymbiont of Lariophagus distinguendus]
MDKVNKIIKSTSSNQIWSMDTKQINTKERLIILLVIIDGFLPLCTILNFIT